MAHYNYEADDNNKTKGVSFYAYKGDIIDLLYMRGICLVPEQIQFKRIPHRNFVYNVYFDNNGKLTHIGLHLHFTAIQHGRDKEKFLRRLYKTILKSNGVKK